MYTSEKTKKKLMGKRYDKQFTEVKTHMPVNIKKNGYLTSHQENTNYKKLQSDSLHLLDG